MIMILSWFFSAFANRDELEKDVAKEDHENCSQIISDKEENWPKGELLLGFIFYLSIKIDVWLHTKKIKKSMDSFYSQFMGFKNQSLLEVRIVAGREAVPDSHLPHEILARYNGKTREVNLVK